MQVRRGVFPAIVASCIYTNLQVQSRTTHEVRNRFFLSQDRLPNSLFKKRVVFTVFRIQRHIATCLRAVF